MFAEATYKIMINGNTFEISQNLADGGLILLAMFVALAFIVILTR